MGFGGTERAIAAGGLPTRAETRSMRVHASRNRRSFARGRLDQRGTAALPRAGTHPELLSQLREIRRLLVMSAFCAVTLVGVSRMDACRDPVSSRAARSRHHACRDAGTISAHAHRFRGNGPPAGGAANGCHRADCRALRWLYGVHPWTRSAVPHADAHAVFARGGRFRCDASRRSACRDHAALAQKRGARLSHHGWRLAVSGRNRGVRTACRGTGLSVPCDSCAEPWSPCAEPIKPTTDPRKRGEVPRSFREEAAKPYEGRPRRCEEPRSAKEVPRNACAEPRSRKDEPFGHYAELQRDNTDPPRLGIDAEGANSPPRNAPDLPRAADSSVRRCF